MDAITRREGESWWAYIARVGEDHIARHVKIFDLNDNMNIARIPWAWQATALEKTLQRMTRYHDAMNYLLLLAFRPHKMHEIDMAFKGLKEYRP